MIYGADISEFQAGLPEGDFIIIRAHSGYREDNRFREHWAAAKGQYRYGRGVYGYVVPDRDPLVQAQALISLTDRDPPEFGYWSDFEEPGLGHDLALEHIDYLRQTGKAGFYSNVPDYYGILEADPSLNDLPWWAAGYGPNDGNEHPMNPAPPRDVLIHQFTSRWQGQSLDGNVADETAVRAWLGHPKPEPQRHRGVDVPVIYTVRRAGNYPSIWLQVGAMCQAVNQDTYDELAGQPANFVHTNVSVDQMKAIAAQCEEWRK